MQGRRRIFLSLPCNEKYKNTWSHGGPDFIRLSSPSGNYFHFQMASLPFNDVILIRISKSGNVPVDTVALNHGIRSHRDKSGTLTVNRAIFTSHIFSRNREFLCVYCKQIYLFRVLNRKRERNNATVSDLSFVQNTLFLRARSCVEDRGKHRRDFLEAGEGIVAFGTKRLHVRRRGYPGVRDSCSSD